MKPVLFICFCLLSACMHYPALSFFSFSFFPPQHAGFSTKSSHTKAEDETFQPFSKSTHENQGQSEMSFTQPNHTRAHLLSRISLATMIHFPNDAAEQNHIERVPLKQKRIWWKITGLRFSLGCRHPADKLEEKRSAFSPILTDAFSQSLRTHTHKHLLWSDKVQMLGSVFDAKINI